MSTYSLSTVSSDNLESIKHLQKLLKSHETQSPKSALPKLVSADGQEALLPKPLYEMLTQAVQILAMGDAVSFVPSNHLLTTSEAADLLNVSRPHLVKLLDQGTIQSAPKVGTHRRVRLQDLLTYREVRDQQRRNTLQDFSSFLQQEGFYQGPSEQKPPEL